MKWTCSSSDMASIADERLKLCTQLWPDLQLNRKQVGDKQEVLSRVPEEKDERGCVWLSGWPPLAGEEWPWKDVVLFPAYTPSNSVYTPDIYGIWAWLHGAVETQRGSNWWKRWLSQKALGHIIIGWLFWQVHPAYCSGIESASSDLLPTVYVRGMLPKFRLLFRTAINSNGKQTDTSTIGQREQWLDTAIATVYFQCQKPLCLFFGVI